MKTAFFAAILSLASAKLEAGDCFSYNYSIPGTLSVKAHIQVRDPNTLSFAVLIDGLLKVSSVCENEAFEWDASKSAITFGKEPLSACLTDLKKQTQDYVQTPLVMKYDSIKNQLGTSIVLDVTLDKVDTCIDFKTL